MTRDTNSRRTDAYQHAIRDVIGCVSIQTVVARLGSLYCIKLILDMFYAGPDIPSLRCCLRLGCDIDVSTNHIESVQRLDIKV